MSHRRRRAFLLVSLAILTTGAAFGAWLFLRAGPLPEPPFVPLAELDPLVAGMIERAEARVRTSPQSGPHWGWLGQVLLAARLRPEALICFARAEHLDPQEPRWPYLHGVVLLADHPDDEALPFLLRAVERCGPSPDMPRLRVGELLLKQGQLEEAEHHFRLLLAVAADHPRAQLGLARIALARNDPQSALRRLETCLHNPFVRKSAHFLLVKVRQELGDPEGARQALQQASSSPADTDWPDPFLKEVRSLETDKLTLKRRIEQHQDSESRHLLETLERDHPESRAVFEGRRLLAAQDAAGAEKAFRQVIALAPEYAQGHFWLALALRDQGDYRGAVASFGRAIQLQPHHARAHELLGQCLEALGERGRAIEAYRAAVRYAPQKAEAHARLGELLLAEEGHDNEALEHLRRALALVPDDTTSQDAITRIEKRRASKQP